MLNQMWEFVGFLGLTILILILIAIIFAIVDMIYNNIKLSIVKRQAISKLKEELTKANLSVMIKKDDK